MVGEIDGRIEFGKDYKSKRKIIINPDNNLTPVAYVVPKGKHVVVGEGSYVRKGDMLISGGNGFARTTQTPQMGTVIGKALGDFDGIEGVIEVAVGRL
jgi:hypothetical protein